MEAYSEPCKGSMMQRVLSYDRRTLEDGRKLSGVLACKEVTEEDKRAWDSVLREDGQATR